MDLSISGDDSPQAHSTDSGFNSTELPPRPAATPLEALKRNSDLVLGYLRESRQDFFMQASSEELTALESSVADALGRHNESDKTPRPWELVYEGLLNYPPFHRHLLCTQVSLDTLKYELHALFYAIMHIDNPQGPGS